MDDKSAKYDDSVSRKHMRGIEEDLVRDRDHELARARQSSSDK
jgi:hypothetical protein